MSRYKQSIPDRWLEYQSIGKRIHVTPFLAFKVPLQKAFFNNISPEHKFSPSDLIESVPNLSLVIDLTNTSKYYSRNDFLSNGIEYKKIFCPGHQIPSRKLIKRFFQIVDDFVEKARNCNSEDGVRLIGVHCTHGINRTGFFICSYMINKLGYSSEEAILEFNSARGHNIERENYLNALKDYDTHPLQFQPSQYNDTNSTNHFNNVGAEDGLISHKSYRRRYSSKSNTFNVYRPASDYYRNTFREPTVHHHQRYRWESNSFWRNNYQYPLAKNSESPNPSFDSVQGRTFGNRRRRY